MLSPDTLLGTILRLPLRLIASQTEVPILRGPLRGKKWIKGAGPDSYWIGTYETVRLRTFASAVAEGAVVYDVGANVGIYALLASVKVGLSGRVYAFEPLERNLRYLRRHIRLNNLQNCTIIEEAVCSKEGKLPFSAASFESSMGRLSPDGEISVSSTTLDIAIYGENSLLPPTVIKIDVEGGELEVLEGAVRALTEFHPTIFLEIHGDQLHTDCRSFLLAKGYCVKEGYGQLTATYGRDAAE
jgi:FkbM family methyltransferase